MSKDRDDDRQAFRRAMADVRPLARGPVVAWQAPRPKPRRRREADGVLAESLSVSAAELLVETGEELLYRAPALSLSAYRRLRRGEWAIEDEIDLHGMTAAQAECALAEFIDESMRRGLRCVRIVHGKGMRSGPRGPVLKALVDHSLRRREAVLGFASAPARQGGTGAVCVLLKRR